MEKDTLYNPKEIITRARKTTQLLASAPQTALPASLQVVPALAPGGHAYHISVDCI